MRVLFFQFALDAPGPACTTRLSEFVSDSIFDMDLCWLEGFKASIVSMIVFCFSSPTVATLAAIEKLIETSEALVC